MQRLNENALDLTRLLLQAEDLCEVSESEYRLFSETERLKMSPIQFQLKLQPWTKKERHLPWRRSSHARVMI
jgi:hypothetical protein